MHKNKFVSVFRRNTILPLAAYVSYAGFFSAAMPRRTSHVSHAGFPVSLPAADADGTKVKGVILGGTGVRTPTFWSWRTDPPLYKYIKSEILLGLPLFRQMLRPWLLPTAGFFVRGVFAVSQRQTFRRGSRHSCECWLLAVISVSITDACPQTCRSLLLYLQQFLLWQWQKKNISKIVWMQTVIQSIYRV